MYRKNDRPIGQQEFSVIWTEFRNSWVCCFVFLVCTHTWLCVCSVCAYGWGIMLIMCRGQERVYYVPLYDSSSIERGSLAGPGVTLVVSKPGWSSCLWPQHWAYSCMQPHLARDLNTKPHICMASILILWVELRNWDSVVTPLLKMRSSLIHITISFWNLSPLF